MFVFVFTLLAFLVLNYVLVLVLVIPHKILNIFATSLNNESTCFTNRKTPCKEAGFIIEPKGWGWTSPADLRDLGARLPDSCTSTTTSRVCTTAMTGADLPEPDPSRTTPPPRGVGAGSSP
jgi:hypothetical protein